MLTPPRLERHAAVIVACAALTACEKDFTLTSTGVGGASGSSVSGNGTSATDSSSSGPAGSGSTSSGSSGSCPETGDPDLVAYYPLDETTGMIAADCSGHGHDGTVISAPPGGGWTMGHFGGGFAGNGGSGCIDLGAAPELSLEGGPFTVAVWARASSFSMGTSGRYIAGRTLEPDVAGWRIGGDTGSKWGLKYYDTAAAMSLNPTTASQPTNTWMHVVGTFDPSSGTKIYVNGSLAATGALSTLMADSSAHLRIGCRGNDAFYFDGVLDEVRFYSRAFTAQDVTTLYSVVK